MPLPYGLPSPRTWAQGMPIKAQYLRADVAQGIALLGGPPLFIGQQQTAQSIPNSADTAVSLDTELYDNAYGHLDTTSPANYYNNLSGWWLCEGTAAVAYIGGVGATTVGVGYTPFGGSLTTWYGQRGPNPSTSGQRMQPAVTKLIEMTTAGRPNADFLNLVINQNSGASQTTSVGTSRVPWFQARWVAAASGSAPLPVPANPPWAVNTSLTAPSFSGSSTLHVASAAGLVPGGTLGVSLGLSGSYSGGVVRGETVTIANTYVTGSLTVPLTANLVFTHAPGDPVSVPVSAPFLNTNIRDTLNFLLYPPIFEGHYAAGTATVPSASSLPAAAGTTAIPVDTKVVDNYTAFSTSTHVWTAPVAGTYYAYAQCHQSMNTTSQALAAGLLITSANYNGGAAFTWWGGCQAALAGAAAGNCAITRRMLRLNAGDTVAAAAFQMDSGTATTTLDFIGGASVSESRLIILWRGA